MDRGAIHPRVFLAFEQPKKLRLVLLRSLAYLDLAERARSLKGVDVASVRGFHDIVIYHLDSDPYSLFYQLLPHEHLYERQDTFVFEIERFLVWEGDKVSHSQQDQSVELDVSTTLDLITVLRDYESLPAQDRDTLVKAGLLLDKRRTSIYSANGNVETELETSGIRRTIIFVHLTSEREEDKRRLERFVLDPIGDNTAVNLIAAGRSRGDALQFHYVVEMTANPYYTDRFVVELVSLAKEHDVSIATRTIDLEEPIVLDLWSSLAYPAISQGHSRLIASLMDPDLGAPSYVPLDRLALRLANARPQIEQVGRVIRRLGRSASPTVSTYLQRLVRAMLIGNVSEYRRPWEELCTFLTQRLLEGVPQIKITLAQAKRESTHGPVFTEYIRLKGSSLSNPQREALRKFFQFRNRMTHEWERAGTQDELQVQIADLDSCLATVLNLFVDRRQDVGW